MYPVPDLKALKVKVGEGTSVNYYMKVLKEEGNPCGGIGAKVDLERCVEYDWALSVRANLFAWLSVFLP